MADKSKEKKSKELLLQATEVFKSLDPYLEIIEANNEKKPHYT